MALTIASFSKVSCKVCYLANLRYAIDAMTVFEPYIPKIVLAIGAHADDIDFGAAGSLAVWSGHGAEIHYLVLTDGSKGTSDQAMTTEQLVATRQAEQHEASQLIGAKDVHFLAYEDSMLEVTHDLKKDICRVIRQIRPDTVVVMDPTVVYVADQGMINHPDHRAAGQATLDAVYPLARDHLSFPDLVQAEHLDPHKVEHLLLINPEKQNYYIDITSTLERKIEALGCHHSQFPDMTHIADFLRQQAATLGSKTGSQYAEGFVRIDCPA